MNLPKHYPLFLCFFIGSYSTILPAQESTTKPRNLNPSDTNHVCKLSQHNPTTCQNIWQIANTSRQDKNTAVNTIAKLEITPFLPSHPHPDVASLQALKNNYLKDPQLVVNSLKHHSEVVRSQAVFYALKNPDINADSVIELALEDKSQRVKAMALGTNKMNITQIKRLENDSDPEIASLAKLKAIQYAQ